MQTFLPYPSFEMSILCLDRKRLGKQRVEVLGILHTLAKGKYSCRYCKKSIKSLHTLRRCQYAPYCAPIKTPWYSHPAVQMWKGYEAALAHYGVLCCERWTKEFGYRDTCSKKIKLLYPEGASYQLPPWLGNPAFHDSHKSNLLRKDPKYYSAFKWKVPNNLPYVWPL